MAKATEKYEVMYIINPNFTEEQTAAVVEKFKALVGVCGTSREENEAFIYLSSHFQAQHLPVQIGRASCRERV